MSSHPTTPAIGRSVPRKEARDKVTGAAKYVDDIVLPGMLHGVTVRSPAPRGRIKGIVFGDGIPWDQVAVVTAKDIPGENRVALIVHDQPFLADGVVNHPEEPVLLLAHEDRSLLEAARRAVRVEVEPLPAVFTIEDSLAKETIVWGEDNVFRAYLVDKGNVEAAFARPDVVVVEGEYRTGAQEHLYIETNGMIAVASKAEGVTVWGSMQCPYYVHKALVPLFGLAEEQVRVVQTVTGGGFGGKEEYPSLLAGHAALLAWKTGKPVKIIYDRAEDMVATTKRHPSRTRHRTAVTKDGRLVAMDIDFTIDGGAYCTLSPVVLSRGTIHAAGPYHCDNVRIRSRAIATNAPPHGAFRGFGAPQSIFALERHMNRVAAAVGLAPEELRRRNFIRPGQTLATSQVVRERVEMEKLLERALGEIGWAEKKARFAEENRRGGAVKRGLGLACFMHGCGFTGSGEKMLGSMVAVEGTKEGKIRVLVASTEIGQGTNTILSQICADALRIDYDMVEVATPDTAEVPNSGPTVASRTCMVIGRLVETAALGLRQRLYMAGLIGHRYTADEFRQAVAAYAGALGNLKGVAKYEQPPQIEWDDKAYKGDAYGTYAWAVYAAQVAVDTVTYEARVEDFVAVQEIGRVIHPVLAAGQIEGGVAQAVGFALYESVVWDRGRMTNGQMTNYIMPTSVDVPRIRVLFEEVKYPYGPGGAKGIGELPMDGPAPAIANAVEDALGLSAGLHQIPLLPEVLMRAVDATAEGAARG